METYKLYKDKVVLTFDSEKHTYFVKDKRIEGVTGVTGIINKPALMYWAVNMTVEFLSKALKPGKKYDEIQLKGMLESAKYAHRQKATKSADIGTIVHQAIETYIKTGKQTNPVNNDARRSFKKFLQWVKNNDVKFFESERKVYSEKFEYAGTMDFYCETANKRLIGDIKTSSGIWDEYWLQTSAYQQAYQEETNARIDGHIIVRVSKIGELEVVENYDYDKNVLAFNGALALYKRMMEIKDSKNGKNL